MSECEIVDALALESSEVYSVSADGCTVVGITVKHNDILVRLVKRERVIKRVLVSGGKLYSRYDGVAMTVACPRIGEGLEVFKLVTDEGFLDIVVSAKVVKGDVGVASDDAEEEFLVLFEGTVGVEKVAAYDYRVDTTRLRKIYRRGECLKKLATALCRLFGR
jgi:hypothetical protein